MRSSGSGSAPNSCASSAARSDRAVRDEGDVRAARDEVPDGELADLAGADDENLAAAEVAEHLLGERGGRRRDGRRALADRCLRTRLAAGVQRLAEEPVEDGPGSAGAVRLPHLAEDLSFARDQRVQSCGHAAEVQRRGLVVEAVERRAELGLEREQRRLRLALRLFRRTVREVELGAVARRQAHGLAGLAGERTRELPGAFEVERGALA